LRYSLALFRSIIFWIGFAIASLIGSLGGVLFMKRAPKLGRATIRFWAWSHRMLCRFVLGQRIRIIGELTDEPRLYVFKHESAFETVEQPYIFQFPAVFAKRELFDIPLWGKAASNYGLIPVDREGGSKTMRAMLAAAKSALAQGRPLCLFAEGPRIPRGKAPPLRAGFAGIYRMLNVAVTPVAIDSGDAYPNGKWVKWPGTITYVVGETIPPGLDRAEAEDRVWRAINALNPPEALLASTSK
jgi:1-acyl-sn-glycerol-3-phosphate acyltransferase